MDFEAFSEKFDAALRAWLPFLGDRTPVPEDALVDLGLDSLTVVQVIGELENVYDIEFPDELVNADVFATVQSLRLATESLLRQETDRVARRT